MSSLLISRSDVEFLLFGWLDVTRLTGRPAFADHSRQTFDRQLVQQAGSEERKLRFIGGKLAACRYFYRWELPRIDRWLGLLEPVDRTPLDVADDWFG